MKDYNSTKNQEIKEKFVNMHVYSCVNGMVEYILQQNDYENAPFTYDDIENLYVYNTDSFGELSEEEKKDKIEELQNVEEEDMEELESQIAELENCESEPQEIFQWFMVSEFLLNRLSEKGHCVISSENLWGRGTCGQAILLDHVISEICSEMEILEGQKYEWKNV